MGRERVRCGEGFVHAVVEGGMGGISCEGREKAEMKESWSDMVVVSNVSPSSLTMKLADEGSSPSDMMDAAALSRWCRRE